MVKPIFLLVFLLLLQRSAIAQYKRAKQVDSLLNVLTVGMPDTNRILALWELGKFYLSNRKIQDDKQAVFPDSTLLMLSYAVKLSDSLYLNVYKNESQCRLGAAYLLEGNFDEGKRCFLQVINNYKAKGDIEKEAKTWLRFGKSLPREYENWSTINYAFEQALRLYKRVNRIEKQADVNVEIADQYFVEGKLNLAQLSLTDALTLYQKAGTQKLYNVYYLLSVVNRYQGYFDKALLYVTACIKNAESLNKNLASIDVFYGEAALVYQELGRTGESIDWYYKTLLERERQNQSKVVVYRTAGFLVLQLIKQYKAKEALALMNRLIKKYPCVTSTEKATMFQNMGYCYNAQKKYGEAEKYFLDMIAQYEKIDAGDAFVAIANQDMGKFYLTRQQYEKAHYFLSKAINAYRPISDYKETYLLLFKADSSMGNYLSAIKDFQQYKVLNDSVFNDKKSRQIEELNIQYKIEKKDQDIKLKEQSIQLLTKQSELEKSRAVLLKNVTIISITFLLVVLGLLYSRYILKQKANKTLVAQQSEISEKNNSLLHLVNEKEWLLKEIHHRVKNNLQIIMGLLNSQSVYLNNGEALIAIKDSQRRVNSISLIHQKLYQSETLSTVDMPAYIFELVEYLKDSFNTGNQIHFEINIQPVELDVTQAIPLGLICNEAITNSIKYAFPEQAQGMISVSLQQVAPCHYLLTISDDGIGLPLNFDNKKSSSLGMSLIKGLSEDIDGSFSIESWKGTVLKIDFVKEKLAHHTYMKQA